MVILRQVSFYKNIDEFINMNYIIMDLRFVEHQTDDICKLAVRQDGRALQYVKNQTYELCRLAVQQYGCTLQFVKNTLEL